MFNLHPVALCRVNNTTPAPYSYVGADKSESCAASPRIGAGLSRVSSPRVPLPILPESPGTRSPQPQSRSENGPASVPVAAAASAAAGTASLRPASRGYMGSVQLKSAAGQRLSAAAAGAGAVPLKQPSVTQVKV